MSCPANNYGAYQKSPKLENFMKKLVLALTAGLLVSGTASARDQLSLAGSSTVLPFATIIAEEMGKNPNFKTPVVESGGSSVGKKGVCDGIGTEFIADCQKIEYLFAKRLPKELVRWLLITSKLQNPGTTTLHKNLTQLFAAFVYSSQRGPSHAA